MAPRADDSDAALVESARRGDRQALDALVRRHDRWVRGVVYATLGRPGAIDDVAQQVWTSVCRQIGSLVDPAAWRSWLFRLARNAALDAGERDGRVRRLHGPLPPDGEVAERSMDPAAVSAAEEERERMLRAIQSLPTIYREPFVLKHLEDWSYARIGATLGLPVDTVETRLVRARRLLRESLRSGAADAAAAGMESRT